MRLPTPLMTLARTRLRRIHTACAALTLAGLVAACGGTQIAAGGVGSGGSGVAEGWVSGFGSVILAGVEYDDTSAIVVEDNAQGQAQASQVKLGQRVRIEQSQQGVADRIQVLPQLRGNTRSAQNAQGLFELLGQSVQIITRSDAQNTVTVLEGLSTVEAGDAVEVHGNWVFDSQLGHAVLQATRIEKLSTSPDPVLLSAVVRDRNGSVLTLDDAQGQTLYKLNLPDSLGAQSLITAWLPARAFSSLPLAASRVVDASPTLANNQQLVLNTQISQTDTEQGYVQVQGMRVKLPTGTKAPAVGSTVQLSIVRESDELKATSLTQRQDGNDMGGLVQLKGSVLWPANPSQLNLRSVRVNVPTQAWDTSCAKLRTNDKVYLDIQAQRSTANQALQATRVTCSAQIPQDSVIEVSGTLSQLNLAQKTLQISTPQSTLNLVWTPNTYVPSNLDKLLNQRVEVEYQIVNGEYRLRKLHPD